MCVVLFVCINNENLNEILNKEDRMKQCVFVCPYVYVCVCVSVGCVRVQSVWGAHKSNSNSTAAKLGNVNKL